MGPKNVYVRKKDVEKREEVNERKREKVLKKERGITLIALMITIIVLLILAAVTLNLALGERGIFKTASDAKIKTERAEIIEKAKLDIVDVQTRKHWEVYRKLINRNIK